VQKIADEFQHGEQFLAGEFGFITPNFKTWNNFDDDLQDEAEAFITGFDAAPLDPAQTGSKFLLAIDRAPPYGQRAVVDALSRSGPYHNRSATRSSVNVTSVNTHAIPRH
jgi:hypothetical protein